MYFSGALFLDRHLAFAAAVVSLAVEEVVAEEAVGAMVWQSKGERPLKLSRGDTFDRLSRILPGV